MLALKAVVLRCCGDYVRAVSMRALYWSQHQTETHKANIIVVGNSVVVCELTGVA